MHPAEELVDKLKDFPYPKRAELPDEEADMVMKGGITSGVVYPLAVCELAKKRRFRNLGGSSAGGIAAGLAAVAELARDTGGYGRLATLPVELGKDLLHLFQPSRQTKPLYAILLASMGKGAWKVPKMVAAVVGVAPSWFLSGFLGSLLFGFWALLAAVGWPSDGGDEVRRFVIALAFTAVPSLVLGLVAALVGVAVTGKARLEANGYGLCRGSAGSAWPDEPPAAGHVEPFTDWLHAKLNHVAARDRAEVVTFSDLWGADPDDPVVRLEMMTTNVTFCRPVRLPFEKNIYSFCRTELAEWFPPPVIDHLVAKARPPTDDDDVALVCPDHGEELVRLPVAADLPVLMAVRMTLSFPLLISPVPLFAVNYGCDEPKPVRCWFADGGISSNFPIHFFDALWPGRPTFGISLGPYPSPQCRKERKDVYFRDPAHTAFPRVRDTNTFTAFLAAMADTLQNWSDEGQAQVPGFRDRIVEVRHTEDEGGMNLNMSEQTILDMCERGWKAAVELDAKFDFDRHRKVRYRTAMARLDAAARDMLRKYDNGISANVSGYRALLSDKPSAVARTDVLLEFVGRSSGVRPPPDFLSDEPRPVPDLRVAARF